MVIRRLSLLAVVVFIAFRGIGAQDGSRQQCRPHSDPQVIIAEIIRGDSYDDLKEFISFGGTLVSGQTRMRLSDALKSPERKRIFNEDSTRIGLMDVMSSESGDARTVVLRTTNATGGELRYHSVSLFRKPTGKWQIWLWHVGP
jgi:hypothetical protein